jgi:hypothetical protein
MDFTAVTLFLVLYYVRPHEWISAAQSLRFAAFSLAFAIVATLMRERRFSPADILRTPHDWMMLLYFAWIVLSAPSIKDTLGNTYNYFIYYVVTVQALFHIGRVQRFLNWWTVCILLVAAVALSGEFGYGINNSYDITHGHMKGRLILNVSIFNNPNALGHSVTPVLVMLYFICFWNRPIFMKIAMIPMAIVPVWCLYLTQSKGSFLAAFSAMVTALVYNRPKWAQAIILTFALTVGWAGMHMLPRMQELDKAQADQGIQGRIAAFTFGRDVMHRLTRGIGYGNFEEEFTKVYKFHKTAHSSYVQIGCELGRTGLFLFLAIIYCSFRTLVACKTHTVAEERVRRILFTLLISYVVSSWMVGFAFRATFFMMVGAIAAFHRQLLWGQPKLLTDSTVQVEPTPDTLVPIGFQPGRLRPAFAGPSPLGTSFNQISVTLPETPQAPAKPPDEPPPEPGIVWNRIGLFDIACVMMMFYATDRFWGYIMRHI